MSYTPHRNEKHKFVVQRDADCKGYLFEVYEDWRIIKEVFIPDEAIVAMAAKPVGIFCDICGQPADTITVSKQYCHMPYTRCAAHADVHEEDES